MHTILEIGRNPGIQARDLANVLRLDKSNTSRQLAKLEAASLVRWESASDGARSYDLSLTDAGQVQREVIDRFSTDQASRALSRLAPAARRLAVYDDKLMTGVMPTSLVLQVALFRLVRPQGRRRALWAGFLTAGLLAMLSFACGNRLGPARDGCGHGQDPVRHRSRVLWRRSDLCIWAGYADLVFRDLLFLPHSLPVVAVV